MAPAEPLLLVDGLEVVNGLRAMTYLRRGLGGAQFQATLARPLTPEVGYRDDYVDVYEADPFWPGNLLCHCPLLDGGPYVSPAADPAPWYDPSRPESGDFLGMTADITVSPSAVRSISPRSEGGATVGRQRLRQRVVTVAAQAYALSPAGAAWGEAWLRDVLAGAADGCADSELTLVPACPPAGPVPKTYLRRLRQAGLIDGPVPSPIQGVGACHVQDVGFQLAAGHPYLLGPVVDGVPQTILRHTPAPCCTVAGPLRLGETATRITINAGLVGSTVKGVVVRATPGPCPGVGPATITYTLAPIPRGGVLVIDSSSRQVTVTDRNGAVIAGSDALGLAGLVPWISAAAGEQVCVCVDASAATLNAGSLARVETFHREL